MMGSPEDGADAALQLADDRVETTTALIDTNDDANITKRSATSHHDAISNGVKQEEEEQQQDDGNTTVTTLRPSPESSIKRRESQAAMEAPEFIEKANNKKRKRVASPPWQFPTADQTTLKSADGRRISARFSNNAGTPIASENESRARSSSSLSAAPRSSRAPSPPWKKFEAEGPASVMVGGQRKSGRVNKDLTEGGQPKRVSPRSKKSVDNTSSHATSKATSSQKVHARKASGLSKKEDKQARRESSPSDQRAKLKELKARLHALQPTRSFSPEGHASGGHKRKRSDGGSLPQVDGSTSPSTKRKTPRSNKAPESPEAANKRTPKLKLRFTSGRYNIPAPHPNAKPPSPTHPPEASLHQLLDECDLREMQQPYMENERGPPDSEWFKQRALRQAQEEGAMRRRILKEAESGGLLSRERCSVYKEDAEPQPEPPKVYTHLDHLVNHVQNFRQLQVKESENHKMIAKKLAREAVEYYKKKRGPTEEDIRAEQDRVYKLIYKQVVADVKAKWDLVSQHVQRKRHEAWEAGEELKRQRRLEEKLAMSENMVARQRGALDEDSTGDIDEDASEESDAEENEESSEENMSDSESDEAQGSDGEDEGDMDEADLQAYKAARDKEKQEEEGEDEDAVMTDTVEPTPGSSEPEPGATPLPEPATPDASLADLLGSADNDDEGSEEDFQPADSESQTEAGAQDENDEPKRNDADVATRRSRRSSVAADTDDAANLSDDDSEDMDSEDYDSDENMSETDEDDVEAGDELNDDDEAEDSANDDEDAAGTSLLGFYSMADRKSKLKASSLPTPTTSAEGDSGDIERQADVGTLQADERDVADTVAGAELQEEDTSDLPTPKPGNAPLSKVEKESMDQLGGSDVVVEDAEEVVTSPAVEKDEEAPARQLVSQPVLLRGTLRSYQHAGLDWLASLYRDGTNGILADEMGLGKTIQTIALLAHLAEEYGCWEPHLVIVPTSVVLNWVTEFQKFLPGFRVLAYYGTSDERIAKRRNWANDPHLDDKTKRGYNVVVTSYNIAMQDVAALRVVNWHYLVLDEAHNIRNFQSQRWQTLIRLKSQARLLLTGTPLQNSLTELWSLLTFLTAGDDDPAHGDLEEFLSHWRDPVREIFDAGVQSLSAEAQKVVEQLHISLRPFLLRRLKSEVEKDLPKKTESVVVCKLSKRQRQLYQEYMGLAEVKKSLTQGNAVSAGKVLLSLRRVCNHPDLFDPRGVESSWGMERSVAEEFGVKEDVVRRLLGKDRETPTDLIVIAHEAKGKYTTKRARQLTAKSKMTVQLTDLEKTQKQDAGGDPSSIHGCRAMRRVRARQEQIDHLRSTIRFSDHNLGVTPIYGSDLQELLTIKRDRPYKVKVRPPPVPQPYGHPPLPRPPQPVVFSLRGWPEFGSRPLRFESEHPSDWVIAKDSRLQQSIQTHVSIGEKLHETLTRFAFVTPAVTAPVLDYLIPERTQLDLRANPAYPLETDFAHEARVRLSINFPDSRLLVYDSGKLQRLTSLLRELQSKGSRSLIFTQMTGTLNILEQFLSLMGLPYLRLDGNTSTERRHLCAQEFNRPDSKYQCMILSSRAGGVGLNLIGASSVIFYDLDWNPQMDRQCMDRAHRIGQVRDVEVYKMVSEKTVEENILRRAEQKSLLDQTVIQEGHFTTDYEIPSKRKGSVTPTGKDEDEGEEDVAVAIERFLGSNANNNGAGGNDKQTQQALESVEDREDVVAAQRAHKEEHQDDADFGAASNQHSGRATPAAGLGGGVEEEAVSMEGHVDKFMVGLAEWMVRDVVYVPPVVRKDKRAADKKRKR